MKSVTGSIAVAMTVGLLLGACAEQVPVEKDPLEVAPENFKIVLENERVRVLENRMEAGEKVGMHAHPDYLVIDVTPSRAQITTEDGSSRVVESRAGEASWSEGETHAVENLGAASHALIVELKK